MEQTRASRTIAAIQADLNWLTRALHDMDMIEVQDDREGYEKLSNAVASRSELITCRLRKLVYPRSMSKQEYLLSAAAALNMKVSFEDDIWKMWLPGLAPKRRKRYHAAFILDPFEAVVEQYAKTHITYALGHCTVCFVHVYQWDMPERCIRDYDNLELKGYLDIAVTVAMVDDGGSWCDVYHTTELGEEDCLWIFIMDSRRFPEWIKARKKGLQAIEKQ